MASKAELEQVIRNMTFPAVGAGGVDKQWTIGDFLRNIENDQDVDRQEFRKRFADLEAKLDALLKAVK